MNYLFLPLYSCETAFKHLVQIPGELFFLPQMIHPNITKSILTLRFKDLGI